MRHTRKKVFFIGIIIWITVSTVSTLSAELLALNYTSTPSLNSLIGTLLMMPISWIYAFTTLSGIVSMVGIILAIIKQNYIPLLITFIGAIVFGIQWQKQLTDLMSI